MALETLASSFLFLAKATDVPGRYSFSIERGEHRHRHSGTYVGAKLPTAADVLAVLILDGSEFLNKVCSMNAWDIVSALRLWNQASKAATGGRIEP